MDALTYDEPSKSKKGTLKKIEERGEDLAYLQRKCRELGIPVLVIVEGLSAAGKGTIINHMIQPLTRGDSRSPALHLPTGTNSCVLFWRFWRRTPSADRMAIFDRSWYRSLLDAQINGIISEADLKRPTRMCGILSVKCGMGERSF